MICQINVKHIQPFYKKTKIFPVFLPFAGCPKRCIYCDQRLQTGTEITSLRKQLEKFKNKISLFFSTNRNQPVEIGFFGGTFTAIKEDIALDFLKIANHYKQIGLVTRIRCSTRPDFINKKKIEKFKSHGLDLIELGVQSFDNDILETSKREYKDSEIFNACNIIKELGLSLGIQLMPGLPLSNLKKWKKDIDLTCKLKPEVVRIYPCVVIKETELEKMFIEKKFIPWNINTTIKRVARAVFRFWKNNIHVIRIGLPPQPEIIKKIVAGPWHPSLGHIVKSYVLTKYLLSILLVVNAKKIISIEIPTKLQADLFGYKSEGIIFLKNFGLDKKNIFYSNGSKIKMVLEV